MRTKHALLTLALGGVIAAVVIGGARLGVSGEPANKVSAAGATTEVFGPGESVTLLQERVKTAKPEDLILGVTAECAITTDLTTVGNDTATAFGQVRVWIEIDGKPVKVAQGDSDGRVVFCNRAQSRTTTLFDDEDATIATFEETRQANGFNWMALNVGSATHTITVKAELTEEATPNANAQAVVGKRTLIVEPVHSAHDEVVTPIS